MNRWQEVLWGICYGPRSLVNPKAVAYRLRKAYDYCSDICRRERVDPFAVFNEALRQVDHLAATDPRTLLTVATPITNLLFDGTGWMAVHADTVCDGNADATDVPQLCGQTGVLLKDLGGALESLARVESDGCYTSEDDANIAEFRLKAGQCISRLQLLCAELHRRRHPAKECPS